MLTFVFTFVGGSLVVDQVYQSCDVRLVEWYDWEDLTKNKMKESGKGTLNCLRSIQAWFRGLSVIVVVLTGPSFTFRHIYWIRYHVSTHILDRVSRPDTYIGLSVTFRHM
uniref:Uncharacterized protein n=1 Tax=Solanum tuberosum TaxID=4113 RepID=M1DY09_SOLTU